VTRRRLLRYVRDAIVQIDQLLGRGTFDRVEVGYPSSIELAQILEELRRREAELSGSGIRPNGPRMLGIARLVIDRWWKYNKEPLAQLLVLIDVEYDRKWLASQ
jgi:hypothetical protein